MKSNCTLHAVCLAGGQQSLDIHSSILHDAEETVSRQQQRNVIGEKGEVVFKGRIRVPKHAQLTDSEQLCRSIMMYGGDKGSRGGRLVAMPTLEITADNVECSHGASVTDLDENSMFYLATRGIERKEARKMLLRGFVFDTLILPECKTMDKNACDRVFAKLAYLNPSKDDDYGSEGKEGYVSM
jgi:Fe-S cluster assembly protein SufD